MAFSVDVLDRSQNELRPPVGLDQSRLQRRGRIAVTAAVVCLASACVDGGSEAREFRNVGKLCLYPASETQTVPGFGAPIDSLSFRAYQADQPINVAVHFPTCLSQSCSVDRQASCTAAFASGSSQNLVISSYGSFEQKTHGACTADCGYLIARCSSPALAAGDYTFEHGSVSTRLTIPSTGPPPCVDTQER